MIKCPFCQYDNEDGALFCEQCKSDLTGVQPLTEAGSGHGHSAAEQVPDVGVMEEEVIAFAPVAEEEVPMAAAEEEALPLADEEAVPLADAQEEEALAEASPEVGHEAAVPMATSEAEAIPVHEAEPYAEAPAAFAEPAQAAAALSQATPVSTPPVAPPAEVAQPAGAAAAASAESAGLPPGAQPRFVVLRGLRLNVEYPLYEGMNFIGRSDEKPVDVDLEDQEPPDRIWSSRQHALVSYEDGKLLIEDLNSSNGTFVNRTRIYPGQKRPLNVNDVVQIGTVQLKLKA